MSFNLFGLLAMISTEVAIRKIAVHLTPIKTFIQDGDNFVIKTQSAFKSYELRFAVGVEKEEFTKGFDNRMLKTLVTWEGDKLVAIQNGEKANRGWKHWIEDDKLYLELTCEDAVYQQVYKRKD
ncbi:retinol-binding protein 2-like [Sinocyclocheilus grahami]|uniref:Retinol-binding protein 2-like n=1 Tax=Sinocyclocheilus grahami TaxID=75366 RepID=A0A672MY97_SINGR|nr:PREDICTED: retinol-binding protein 2-like [Sinocyclocheilus grahami]